MHTASELINHSPPHQTLFNLRTIKAVVLVAGEFKLQSLGIRDNRNTHFTDDLRLNQQLAHSETGADILGALGQLALKRRQMSMAITQKEQKKDPSPKKKKGKKKKAFGKLQTNLEPPPDEQKRALSPIFPIEEGEELYQEEEEEASPKRSRFAPKDSIKQEGEQELSPDQTPKSIKDQ